MKMKCVTKGPYIKVFGLGTFENGGILDVPASHKGLGKSVDFEKVVTPPAEKKRAKKEKAVTNGH